MREFQERQQEKNKIRRRLFSKTTLFFMFLFIIILARGVYGISQKHLESKQELDRINAEYDDVEKRYNDVSRKRDRLSNDDGVEVELRGKYDISKPNEKVIVVVEPEEAPVPEEEIGLLRRMWNSLTGVFR